MARTSTAKSVAEVVIVEEEKEATIDETEKNMIKENKKNATKSINAEQLEDYDEIEVESLIPNVSYKDNKTGDMYEWDDVGHIEYMTFETLKNMWRNHKGYFRNMWLKPNDDRVINKFGLTKTFEKYEYLMDKSNYVKKNMHTICSAISDTPNGLKTSICNKIKHFVISGDITDVNVIKALEKNLKLDLIEFL